MRFNDFLKNRRPQTPPPQNDNDNLQQQAQEALNKYGGMGEEQLMQELFRNAEQGRRDGTLSNEVLDNFVANAAGFLTPEQQERMSELVRELKK